MTNPGMFGRPTLQQPMAPKGDVLGTYETYLEAKDVIERLSQNEEFPIDALSIVGNDLKTVERVTGRLSYGKAALGGALTGFWFGGFAGLLLSLFNARLGFLPVIAAALIGAAFGVIFGVISFAVTKRTRDFSSSTQVLASNYQVLVRPDLTARAQNVLGGGATSA